MDFYLLFFIIVAAFIWFDTEAVPEYLSLFGFRFHRFDEWRDAQAKGSPFDYHTYLLVHFPNFFVRLVTCPYCLIVWLTLPLLFFVPFEAFAAHIAAGWVGYFGLRKLLKWLNE